MIADRAIEADHPAQSLTLGGFTANPKVEIIARYEHPGGKSEVIETARAINNLVADGCGDEGIVRLNRGEKVKRGLRDREIFGPGVFSFSKEPQRRAELKTGQQIDVVLFRVRLKITLITGSRGAAAALDQAARRRQEDAEVIRLAVALEVRREIYVGIDSTVCRTVSIAQIASQDTIKHVGIIREIGRIADNTAGLCRNPRFAPIAGNPIFAVIFVRERDIAAIIGKVLADRDRAIIVARIAAR